MYRDNSLSIIVVGLGPIGLEIIRNSPEKSIIGAVDIDPNIFGKDVGQLAGCGNINVQVVDTVKSIELIPETRPIAIHATGSNLEHVWPQIKELLNNGYSVVSTCEELAFPWYSQPSLASEIDNYAKEKGLSVIGTGVNPGFIMDTLAVCFSMIIANPTELNVIRKVDVSKRRMPLQKKVGVGLTKSEFYSLFQKRKIGHVGLIESGHLIAKALDWKICENEDISIEPTFTNVPISTPLVELKEGDINGLHQVYKAETPEGYRINLDLTMSLGIQQKDEIIISNKDLSQRLIVPDGVFGDTATAAAVINTAKSLYHNQKLGLLTMIDIGLPRFKA